MKKLVFWVSIVGMVIGLILGTIRKIQYWDVPMSASMSFHAYWLPNLIIIICVGFAYYYKEDAL